jgi:hypothetical protein
MTAVRIEHTFDCDEKTFWDQVFFSEPFNRDMYLKHLQFKRWQVTEYRETDTAIYRTVSVTPKIGDLPGAIKSLIGDNLGYREEGKFDKQSQRYSVVVVPSSLADKISVRGDTWVQPLEQGRCKRIFDAEVSVKMFGVGTIIEKKIIADLQLSYNAGAVFTAEYLKRLAKLPASK